MKNLYINDCFFHGIRNNKKQDATEVFKDILNSKYILTHNSLRKCGMPNEREITCWQGANAISICFHPTNTNLYNYYFDKGNTVTTEKGAFEQYVYCEKPSIILNPNIINELKIRKNSGYKRLSDEIQVIGDISLSYMIAIGYGNSLETYVNALKNFINYGIWDSESLEYIKKFQEIYNKKDLEKQLSIKHKNIALIKDLLEKYNYNISIINPKTGALYPSLEEEFEMIEDGIKLIKNVK